MYICRLDGKYICGYSFKRKIGKCTINYGTGLISQLHMCSPACLK